MNSKLKHLHAVTTVVCLRLVGIMCIAAVFTFPLYAQGTYECFFSEDFTDLSKYTTSSNDCDGNIGTFGVDGGRFTVNDVEGLTCIGDSGGADNELSFRPIDISEFRNITLTFEYTIKDASDDGFECTSVFGNGDDLIFMDYTVNGRTTRVNVFCEDTPGNIEQRKRSQVAIPDGANLDLVIYAGTQAPSEFFYFDRIQVCGNRIDTSNPPVDPPPPPPVQGNTFQESSSAVRCTSGGNSSEDILLAIKNSIYADFNNGTWFDSEGNMVTMISPSSPGLLPGDNLFRYVLPDGNTSTFTLTLIDNSIGEATLGPFCGFTEIIDLPTVINGYSGRWQSAAGGGVSGGLQLDLSNLSLGDNNEIAFTPENSGCLIFFKVDVIDKLGSPTIKACDAGTINLLDSFPDLTKIVEEIDFKFIDDRSVIDPENLDLNDYQSNTGEYAFYQEIPSDIGCGRTGRFDVLVDAANCPTQADPLSAVISIDPVNGNICFGECGTLSVDIKGGTPPYEIKFLADIPFTFPVFNIPLPTIPFPATSVTGDSYSSNICSAPDITIDDLFLQNDIVYNSATNTWNIPTFFAVRGTIGGSVVDADGTEVDFDNQIEMQAFDKPAPPIDATDILPCPDEVTSYGNLPSVDNFSEIEWFDGDPDSGGSLITDFTSLDLTNLYGIWTNPEGCQSDPFLVEFTQKTVAECSNTCTTAPPMPEFINGIADTTVCNDGSFQGFRIDVDATLNLQYNWYDRNDVLILADDDTFNPSPLVEGDFYVIAIDGDCPFSAKLNFSISFFDPNGTECSTACVRPDIPEFVSNDINRTVCDDGSFAGFIITNPDNDLQYDWFEEGTNVSVERDITSFVPPNEGDFYVNAVRKDDPTCRSNNLQFTYNYYETTIIDVDCSKDQNGITVNVTLDSDDVITRTVPNALALNGAGNRWTLVDLQENTDYELILIGANGCQTTIDLLASSYTCVEAICEEAGDNVGPIPIQMVNGPNQVIDLTDYLVNATGIGIFLDENNNQIADPTAYTFTSNVIITHVIEMAGSCSETRATLDFRLQGGSIDGTVCADNVFCDEISIVLSSGLGSGAPYTMRFEMFDAAVIQEIVFEQQDVLGDTALVVTVCVSGTDNIYDANSKTLFIAEGTPAGEIRVTELRDGSNTSLGTVPPIEVDFSPIPTVTPITDIVRVCMSESNEYPIRDLNDQISNSQVDIIEWWYKQPSDDATVDADKVLADAAVNPNDSIYALVISPDNCKVEVPVRFTLIADEFVDVAYDQFNCIGDPLVPTTLVDNGFDIDFDYSPRNATRIIRSTGEIVDPVVGTVYTVSWITKGACPVSDSTKITVIPAGDARCSCPTIPVPVIGGTNVPAQPGLEGEGISYCFDDNDPPLIITNNPGNLEAVWFASRAETNEVFRGDQFLNADNSTNYYVRFEDDNECGSELTPVFTIRNPGQRLTTKNISICANEESSIDLTSFLVGAEGFVVDWFDPNGNPIPDPTNYDGSGLPQNELLTLRQEYIDPDGCGDNTQVQFTITNFDIIQLDNFVCNATENFYTLQFNAPSHFNVSSDVGKMSESNGIFLIDSVQIGVDINLTITDNFLNCTFSPATITSPSCNCDALPDPRDRFQRDTICFGDQFEIFNPNGDYTVNWYDAASGGIRILTSDTLQGIVPGTFYAEIIDRVSSCVSERKPFVIMDIVSSPLRGDIFVTSPGVSDINTLDLITCEELQDSFKLVDTQSDYSVVWIDNGDDTDRVIIHEGNTFRPDEDDYPPGNDHEFLVAYQNAFGCISTVSQSLTYRIYQRPRFSPQDTMCSEDLKSVSFVFNTRGTVLDPAGATPLGGNDFIIENIPVGEDFDIRIGRDRTGVMCELERSVNIAPDFCPCPDIDQPEPTISNFLTVCNNVTDATLEVIDPNTTDIAANWFDNEDAIGVALLENSLIFIPPDSGAYYVQFVDTITGCTSIPTQMNLFYDDVPDSGMGMDRTVCGVDSIALDTLLVQPINPDGYWNDPAGQLVVDMVRTTDYAPGVPLEFQYIVVANNSEMCSDTLRVMLTIQPPFNAGVSQDLNPICDQAGIDIDFEAEIGQADIGSWVINDGIDLNQDPILNSNNLIPGEYEFTYVVQADAVCPPQTSYVRVIILDLPEVGVDTQDSICRGAEAGYSFAAALDGNPDLDGIWTDVDGVLAGIDINDNPGQVDLSSLAAGDYVFSYSKASGSCDNSAELRLHIRDNNRAGRDTLFQICNTSNLEINFRNLLPDATAYNLSIDGANNIDFSVPDVDLSSLAPGQYFIRNMASSMLACDPDEAVITLVIEGVKPSPNIEGLTYSVCYGDTIDLADFLMVDGGMFNELIPSGALEGDSLFTNRLTEGSTSEFTYEILPDSVCAVQQSMFNIDLQSPPNAQGIATDGSVCQGDSIDLLTLLGADTDQGGIFEDIEMTGGLLGSILRTDQLGESNPLFSYTVGDGVTCDQAIAFFNVAILETPDLIDSLDLIVCLPDGLSFDLSGELSQRGIDESGQWIDANGTGLDFTDPMNVDVSSLSRLTKYTIQYALSNGMCADTMEVIFEIDEGVSAGEVTYPNGAPFLGHCEGDPLDINLNELLDNEDQGFWFDQNGDTITTSENYDLEILSAGSYTYKYVVRNTNLQVCMDDSMTIQILVEPAPNAGIDDTIRLCENQLSYDLLDLLDAQVDDSGRFNDINNIGNLTGSMVNTSMLTPGTYSYEYVLETNTSCDPDVALLTIEIITNISAGASNRAAVCQGEPFNLNDLILGGDAGGRFEEVSSGTAIDGNIATTTIFPSGELNIWYIVESVSCESDTADLILDIRLTPDLGVDIDGLEFCESESSDLDLNTLLSGRDQSGQWLDPTNLGIDLTDVSAVDLSTIEPLVPSMLAYTVTNGECADTIAVSFTIDPQLTAGVDIAPIEHCEGRTEVLDLYEDLFPMPIDQGVWTIDGVPIPDPQDFELKDLEARDHVLMHSVENTNLGICDIAVQMVTLTVYPAVSAGDSTVHTLCQIPTAYNLLDLIDADADATGVFEAIDNVDGLMGTELLTTDLAEGTYEYLYIVPGSANCEPDSAVMTISIVASLDAGSDGVDMVCQGVDFDLRQLVISGDGDAGGLFTNMTTGVSYTYEDANLITDNLTGSQVIRYLLESENCDPDQSEYQLTINPSYDIIEEINIAEGDSAFIDGAWRFVEETFIVTGSTAVGCDSIVTTILTISDVKVDVEGVSCVGLDDGMIAVTVSAGTGPFNIQITQITGGNGSIGGTLTSFGMLDFDFFTEGDYNVFVTESTSGDTIYNEDVTLGVTNQIIPTIVAVDATCFGDTDGSLTVTEITIDGIQQNLGAYTYEWSTGDITSAAGNLTSGFYQLMITDTISSCPFTFESLVGEPEALLVDTIINPFQCGGTQGSIELDLLSDVDDLPEFSINGGLIQGVGLFSALDAGLYDVTIDYGACSQTFEDLEVPEATDNIIEIEPNDVILISGQIEEINVLINFQAINVEWSSDLGLDTTNQLNPILTATETNDYIITVTDGFGCTVTDTLKVEVIDFQDPVPDIFVPNVFNPLSTGVNGKFVPEVEPNYPGTFEMQVFNRWGNVVYDNIQEVYDPNGGWDGMYNGRLVEIGVYSYIIKFRFENGTYLKLTGDLTVIY